MDLNDVNRLPYAFLLAAAFLSVVALIYSIGQRKQALNIKE
jgi:hypothetical protein